MAKFGILVTICIVYGLWNLSKINTISSTPPLQLQCVDLSPFYDENASTSVRKNTADALLLAARETGAVRLTGFPKIANRTREDLFQSVHRLFSIPKEEKQDTHVSRPGFVRGFIPIAGESGSASAVEIKEGFSYGFEWPAEKAVENQLQGSNAWPLSLQDSDRELFGSVYTDLTSISAKIAAVLPLALDWPVEPFVDLCTGGEEISLLRLFHYFSLDSEEFKEHCRVEKGKVLKSQQREEDPECLGSSQHTDWGFLTLIVEEPEQVASGASVGGLEVFLDGSWRTVSTSPTSQCEDSIVFNAGDFLSVLSNGRFMSPKHRVLLKDVDRYTFVFFSYPRFDAKLSSILPKGEPLELKKLSLFENQAGNDASDTCDDLDEFGNYILHKWKQVTRSDD